MSRIASGLKERIQANYIGGHLSCGQLIQLLETQVAPGARVSRNMLVNMLATHRHRNLRAHITGSEDGTNHYTVFVNNQGIHLRLDRQGVIFQITNARGDLSGVPPWIRPGA